MKGLQFAGRLGIVLVGIECSVRDNCQKESLCGVSETLANREINSQSAEMHVPLFQVSVYFLFYLVTMIIC